MNPLQIGGLHRVRWILYFLVPVFVTSRLEGATLVGCTESSLRAGVTAGGHVRFGCDGVLLLSSPIVVTKEVVLDATGRSVVLSGGLATRLFEVRSNASLTLSNLTLMNGRALAGGGVYNEGTLVIYGGSISNCWVTGASSVVTNAVPAPGSSGDGGAIWNSGTARVFECLLVHNFAHGGNGPIAHGVGGFIFMPGAYDGRGGAIFNSGQLEVGRSLFTNNAAVGGIGNASFTPLGLAAGGGGDGLGGAVFNEGSAFVHHSAFTRNNSYYGEGTSPAGVGAGRGGAFCSEGTLHIANTTIADGEALGAPGAGGAVCVLGGTTEITFATLATNYVSGGPGGGERMGAAIYTATNATCRLTHTIVAGKRPYASPPPNVAGPILDLGYNLGSDTEAVFTGTGSQNGVDPLLSGWGDHGGPTPTLAPREGSPAVDAGAPSGLLADDQRGFSRPWGARHDLGAVEGPLLAPIGYPLTPPVLFAGQSTNVTLVISNGNRFNLTGVSIGYITPFFVNIDLEAPVESGCTAVVQRTLRQAAISGFDLVPGEVCAVSLPLKPEQSGLVSGEFLGFSSDQFSANFSGAPSVTIFGLPTAQTLRATDADFTRVTLNGLVDPGGLGGSAWFEYGPDTNSLTQLTAPSPLGAGFSEVPVSATLTGLPSTLRFYYRMAASNELGVTRGNLQAGYTLGDAVMVCEEGNLAPLVARGGVVRFACDGMIQLSAPLYIRTNTTLLAEGHQVTLSGSNAVRLIQVPPGQQLTLHGITLADGLATNGAAVFNEGLLTAVACVFSNNLVQATTGISAGGGALWNGGASLLTGCRILNNTARGGAGVAGALFKAPGAGQGGGVANFGTLALSNCTFRGNRAIGGQGGTSFSGSGPGGMGQGGAVFNAQSAAVFNSTFDMNRGEGGPGGFSTLASPGGHGYGGGLYSTGVLTMTNCTLNGNAGVGGPPGRPGYPFGNGYGGALTVAAGTTSLGFATFNQNRGTNGGGAVLLASNATAELHYTLISHHDANSSLEGAVYDRGYNLSSDAPPALTNVTSCRRIQPKLGPLADNGGPTPTLALLSGSDAIDSGGMVLSTPIDQRGFPRMAGASLDAGSYEGTLGPLRIESSFGGEPSYLLGAPVSLRLSVANTNNNPFTGICLTNQLSAGVVFAGPVSTPPGFNGSVLAVPGSRELVLQFALPPLGSATFLVPVTSLSVGVSTSSIPPVWTDQFGIHSAGIQTTVLISGPPDPRVTPVTEATFTTATLNGLVTAGGVPTWAWFEFGSAPASGQSTAPQLVADLLFPSPISAGISGLSASTDFRYRVVASNQFGVTYSVPGNFFTLGDINTCDDAHLRANLVRGGAIRFGCSGVIQLSAPLIIAVDTELDARGWQVTLHGGHTQRVVEVTAGASAVFRELSIEGGRAPLGGGVLNHGRLVLDRCSIVHNTAAGTNGLPGRHGANAPLRPPAPPASGEPGFPGEPGGSAFGGGIHNDGWCFLVDGVVTGNAALGGLGGTGGNAGSPNYSVGGILISGGQGGLGGFAAGGGIWNAGELVLSNASVSGNQTVGGRGGMGGNNYGSGTAPGGSGGQGFAGGLFSSNAIQLVNVTVSGNSAGGGDAGGLVQVVSVGGGSGFGGGLHLTRMASLLNCTVASNIVIGGLGVLEVPFPGAGIFSTNGSGVGGNLFSTESAPSLRNVVLAHAVSNVNGVGPILDLGHNLASDSSLPFTSHSSRSALDPGLLPLANNGGRTLTHALMHSSPAIDGGETASAPPIDQRGEPRPALTASDIGAFELQPTVYAIRSIVPAGPNGYRLIGFGVPGSAFRIIGFDGVSEWTTLAVGTVDQLGLFDMEVVSPAPYRILRTSAP